MVCGSFFCLIHRFSPISTDCDLCPSCASVATLRFLLVGNPRFSSALVRVGLRFLRIGFRANKVGAYVNTPLHLSRWPLRGSSSIPIVRIPRSVLVRVGLRLALRFRIPGGRRSAVGGSSAVPSSVSSTDSHRSVPILRDSTADYAARSCPNPEIGAKHEGHKGHEAQESGVSVTGHGWTTRT